MRDGVPSRIIFVRVKSYFMTRFALSRNLWILVVTTAGSARAGARSNLPVCHRRQIRPHQGWIWPPCAPTSSMERERLAPLSLGIEKRGRCMRPGWVSCGREGEEREEPSLGLPWGRGGGEGEEGVSEGEEWGIGCDVPSTKPMLIHPCHLLCMHGRPTPREGTPTLCVSS
jgi:hypothetical protein